MNNFAWFQKWFTDRAIETPNKKLDVKIYTGTNSSWYLEIDLSNIKYYRQRINKNSEYISKYNWYNFDIKNNTFIAKADFSKLDFLLGKFREIIGEKVSNKIEQDYFIDQKIQDFIFEEDNHTMIFLHYTLTKDIAEQIMQNGFKFAANFENTTTEMKNDLDYLKFHHYVRKSFGKYVIVICIAHKILNHYHKEIQQHPNLDMQVVEALTENPREVNDNGEEIITLHKKFIKGYFNYTTREIVRNPGYDPFYDSPLFKKNII